jgi:hypothetical protein
MCILVTTLTSHTHTLLSFFVCFVRLLFGLLGILLRLLVCLLTNRRTIGGSESQSVFCGGAKIRLHSNFQNRRASRSNGGALPFTTGPTGGSRRSNKLLAFVVEERRIMGLVIFRN